ncbi:peptidoglycan-binding protein [Streptomyces sp. NPDC002088]|uniref:peptidoglycan-binding domain-containing protein n=1 Tax=Streptomyces sp. NPDC002088 TaxID=3154665 RepID=UPI0033178C38
MAGGLGLATAGTSEAAVPTQVSAASTSTVYNFGLTTTQAKYVQCWLNYWDFGNLTVDGELGTASWKAFQRELTQYWGYTGAIDGIPGTNTIKALQRLLKANWGYTGAIDGEAGSGTQAAFSRFANNNSGMC